VIAVRQGEASELRKARRRLEQRPELLALGTESVLWAILDEVVSGYPPVVKELETDILEVEATVFSGAVAPTERIYLLRRQATGFYRIVHPVSSARTSSGWSDTSTASPRSSSLASVAGPCRWYCCSGG
jgi:magnesium transporter